MTYSSESTVPPAAAVGWYYLREGVRVGPLSERDLLDTATRGEITPDTLVWQPSFLQRWKPAASIPMIAVSLGCFGQLSRDRSATWSRRTNQDQQPIRQTFSEAALQRLTPEDLGDAVNDEEAAEPILDTQQMHEILERASRYPPECSIPPATLRDSLRPAARSPKKHLGVGYLFTIGTGSVLIGVAGVLSLAIPRHSSEDAAPRGSSEPRHEARLAALPKAHFAAAPIPSAAADGASQRQVTDAATTARTPRVSVSSGTLDAQAFETRLQRARPMFDRQCWDRLRLRLDNVTEHPEVRVEISVDRTGHVYDVVSSKAPRGYHGAGLCIIGRMRGWHFPRTDGSTHAIVTVARGRD